MKVAGGETRLATDDNHVCRRKGWGYAVKKGHAIPKPCAGCGMKLCPRARPRPLRIHDLRHRLATLMLKASVPLATAQRILRHSAPAITSEVYGHLDVEDMRKGLNQIAVEPADPGPTKALFAAEAEPAPLALVSR